MLLSLVIPTYNERANIGLVVEGATATLARITPSFEIIVVDDDSPDKTWQLADKLAQRNRHLRVIRRQAAKGLATAVMDGWKASRGCILGVMDADLQHPPATVAMLLDAVLHRGADIAVASRYAGGGGTRDWSPVRRFISWGANSLATAILPEAVRGLRDPMSGYFLVKRPVVESIDLRPTGYKILLEVLARCRYETLEEVAYVFEGRKHGKSKLGPKQYIDFLTHLARLRRRRSN